MPHRCLTHLAVRHFRAWCGACENTLPLHACKSIILLGTCAEDVAAAPELSLEPGWDSGHLLQLLYRTPKQSLLEVKVLQMGDSSMVHWGRQGSAVHSVEVAPADYVTGVTEGAAAYQRERLNGLIGKFAAGLQLTIQVRCVAS